MAGWLSTHVLDTARGRPADGVPVVLYRLEGDRRRQVGAAVTNADGRTDAPLLPEADFAIGRYELEFDLSGYFEDGPDPAFLATVVIRFGMAEQAHYHVPLLVSPYAYSTYRGS